MKLAGLWRDQGLVFPSQVGTLLSARNLQRHFKNLLERAGLPTAAVTIVDPVTGIRSV